MDPKTALQELAAHSGLRPPMYAVTSTGPDHDRRFTAAVTVGDLIAEVRTRRLGSLTYARSTKDPEDISLFDRRRRRNIAVYASPQKRAPRGRFYVRQRLRLGPHAVERDVAAREAGLARPHRAHRVEVLVGARPAAGQRGAQGPELGLEVPDPHAEQEATAAHPVERRHLLGQHQRVVDGNDGHPGAEQQGAGVRRQVGQGDERVEHRRAGPGGRRGDRRVGQHVVLAGPHALPAGRLGRHRDAGRGRRVDGADVGVDEEQSEAHGPSRYGVRRHATNDGARQRGSPTSGSE